MLRQRVYLETTIASYLTARPSRDLLMAARQQLTREWWESRRRDFRLYISQFVLDEAAEGDCDAAQRRLAILEGIPLLDIDQSAMELGQSLLDARVIPSNAGTDALHIAVATVHRVEIVLTWNCTHLANAQTLGAVGRSIRRAGYEPPIICTPEELMGD